MIDVASRELSEELYALSGWRDTGVIHKKELDAEPASWIVTSTNITPLLLKIDPHTKMVAYPLGYVLRKLPAQTYNKSMHYWYWFTLAPVDSQGTWSASYDAQAIEEDEDKAMYFNFAETPEDAAAKLAIELFKQGVLTRVGDE